MTHYRDHLFHIFSVLFYIIITFFDGSQSNSFIAQLRNHAGKLNIVFVPDRRIDTSCAIFVLTFCDKSSISSNEKFFVILCEMNTPTTRDFLRRTDGTRRRSARQALAVIPVNNSASPGVFLTLYSPSSTFCHFLLDSIDIFVGEAISTEVNAMDNFLNSRHGSDSWSPAPSPDELVIQKRGRRRRTIVWSPDDTCKRNSLFRYYISLPIASSK